MTVRSPRPRNTSTTDGDRSAYGTPWWALTYRKPTYRTTSTAESRTICLAATPSAFPEDALFRNPLLITGTLYGTVPTHTFRRLNLLIYPSGPVHSPPPF